MGWLPSELRGNKFWCRPLALVPWLGDRAGSGCPARSCLCHRLPVGQYLPLSKVMVGGKTDRVGSAAVIIDLIVRGNITLNFLHLWGAGCFFF